MWVKLRLRESELKSKDLECWNGLNYPNVILVVAICSVLSVYWPPEDGLELFGYFSP